MPSIPPPPLPCSSPLLSLDCVLLYHITQQPKAQHARRIISTLPSCWLRTISCHASPPRPKAPTPFRRLPPTQTLSLVTFLNPLSCALGLSQESSGDAAGAEATLRTALDWWSTSMTAEPAAATAAQRWILGRLTGLAIVAGRVQEAAEVGFQRYLVI